MDEGRKAAPLLMLVDDLAVTLLTTIIDLARFTILNDGVPVQWRRFYSSLRRKPCPFA